MSRRAVAFASAAGLLGASMFARAKGSRAGELALSGAGVLALLVGLSPEPKKRVRKSSADAPTLEPSSSTQPEPQPQASVPLRIFVQRSGGSSPAVLLVEPASSGWRAWIAKARVVVDQLSSADRADALRRGLQRYAKNIDGHDTLLLSFYPPGAERGEGDVWHARVAPGVGLWTWQVNAFGSNTAAGSSGSSPNRESGVAAVLGFVERQGG